MHHLLCLSGKQMEAVVIGVAQRERTRLDQRASWEISFFFFFFYKPCMQKHLPIPTPIAPHCVYCSLYYRNSKLNAQLQHSPSNINLAGSHASIINVCMAAEDSCIAPSRRITAPALSFLKHRLQGWWWGGGAVSNSGAGKTSCSLNRHKQD